jgi:hypothetical protein
MRKLFVLVLGAAVSMMACEVHVGGNEPAKAPAPAPAPAPQPAAHPATPAPAAHPVVAGKPLGKMHTPTPSNPPPSNPPPAGSTIMTGTNLFGSGTPDPNGWKGSYFQIPAGTSKMPAYASMTPNGFLFASSLNVSQKQMSGGFPGIDPSRNENFGIRWEAPLVVDTESDYMFRLVSDDGSQVFIDDTLIVDNDGVHTTKEVSGPVHLVKGTHAIRVDYYQITGEVSLQLYCGKGQTATAICTTHQQ